MADKLELGLGLSRRNAASAFEGNPASEEFTDESANILTDESGNSLFDSGA